MLGCPGGGAAATDPVNDRLNSRTNTPVENNRINNTLPKKTFNLWRLNKSLAIHPLHVTAGTTRLPMQSSGVLSKAFKGDSAAQPELAKYNRGRAKTSKCGLNHIKTGERGQP